MNRDSRREKERREERERERENAEVALSTSEYLLSSLRWGWLVGGVSGGGPYFYQYLASCARAARSIPSDEPSRSTRRNRQRERKKKRVEGRRSETLGGEEVRRRRAKGAHSCVYVRTLLMSVCIEYRWW